MADPTAPAVTPVFGVPTGTPQAAPVAPAAPAAAPLQAPHHGAISNILGFLGDFLTSRLHMGTPFRDGREKEKLNYALQQDAADPTHQFKNTMAVDPRFGSAQAAQWRDDQRLATAAAGTQENREARLAAQQDAIRTGVKNRAAAYFNTLQGSTPDELTKAYAAGRDLWAHSAAVRADPQLLSDLNDLYPETYNPSQITSSIGASVPVSTQWAQRLTKERIDNQDEQAGARVAATTRGQDLSHQDRQSGQAVTMRGQDIRSGDAAAGRAASGERNAARIAARPAPAPRAAKPTAADLSYLRANPAARDKFDGRFGVGMSKRVLGN